MKQLASYTGTGTQSTCSSCKRNNHVPDLEPGEKVICECGAVKAQDFAYYCDGCGRYLGRKACDCNKCGGKRELRLIPFLVNQ